MRLNCRTQREGLTLIEVMLTMAILGIAGIVLVTSVSQALGVVRATRLYNHAHTLLAQVKLENPLFDEDVAPGTEYGSFPGTEYGTFEWTRTTEQVGDEADGLFEVTVRISWSRRGQSSFEEVVFYRHVPPEAF